METVRHDCIYSCRKQGAVVTVANRPDDLTYWPRPILYDAVIRAVNFIEPCGPSPTECLLPPREFPPSGQSSLVGIGLKRWNGTGTCLRDDDGLSAFIALDVYARRDISRIDCR